MVFSYTFISHRLIQSIAIDYDGDNSDDFTTTNPSATLQHVYSTPGTYTARLSVTDDENSTLSASLEIEVLDGAQMDSVFTAIWTAMNDALVDGDVNTALSFLTPGARTKYADIFDALLPDMAVLIASYSPLQRGFVTSEVAEYAINRMIDGHDKIFFVYFVKCDDGEWRIDAM